MIGLVLILLIFAIVPILFIAGIQSMFCHAKYKILQFLPLAAAFGFTIWCVSQMQTPTEQIGCGMVEMVGDTTMAVIFISLFGGIALGWLMYANEKEKKDRSEEESGKPE